jgi:hypothetical protein
MPWQTTGAMNRPARRLIMNRIGKILTSVVIALALPSIAMAEDRLGGHFGTVFPLVSHAGGSTSTISDQFEIGFPTGISIKPGIDWAFDLELVPVITHARAVSLTVHPGVIRKLPHSFATGVRMAFDVKGSAWGFTPLVNRGYPVGPVTYFVEGVAPIRFKQDAAGVNQTSIGFGVHFGVGF